MYLWALYSRYCKCGYVLSSGPFQNTVQLKGSSKYNHAAYVGGNARVFPSMKAEWVNGCSISLCIIAKQSQLFTLNKHFCLSYFQQHTPSYRYQQDQTWQLFETFKKPAKWERMNSQRSRMTFQTTSIPNYWRIPPTDYTWTSQLSYDLASEDRHTRSQTPCSEVPETGSSPKIPRTWQHSHYLFLRYWRRHCPYYSSLYLHRRISNASRPGDKRLEGVWVCICLLRGSQVWYAWPGV